MRISFALITYVLVFCAKLSSSRPVENQLDDEAAAVNYLKKYGYMKNSDKSSKVASFTTKDDAFTTAVIEFQKFTNLNITGHLDEETLRMMTVPRCGIKDKHDSPANFEIASRWQTTDLTYDITKYGRHLERSVVDDEIRKAFETWSDVTPLKFTKRSLGRERVNLQIRFERGNHDDGYPFDGPGGTIAHAFFPGSGGDIHFDNDETWTVRTRRGADLFQIAVHEFGHALGLAHSNERGAVMFPYYEYSSNFKLHDDDIKGIQSLYGPRDERESNDSGKRPDRGGDKGELCDNGKLDAIIDIAGSVYVLKGSYTWKLNKIIGVPADRPTMISEMWPGLPSDIDAAFTGTNGKVYFFKGDLYWKYNGIDVDGDYPKKISDGFPGIPDNVDAAVWWPPSRKVYFFKGTRYWGFELNAEPKVNRKYPQPISAFTGIPNDLDDALHTNDRVYFFKGGKYYRINEKTFGVDADYPPFPRDAKYYWFGCAHN